MADTTRAIDPANVTFSRRWAKMTKLLQHRIGINGSFFNTHRMSAQYPQRLFSAVGYRDRGASGPTAPRERQIR
jgi:hypothetical protein